MLSNEYFLIVEGTATIIHPINYCCFVVDWPFKLLNYRKERDIKLKRAYETTQVFYLY